jgi:hypothetical protein
VTTPPRRGLAVLTTALFWCALVLVIAGVVMVVIGLGSGRGVLPGVGLVVAGALCQVSSVGLAFAVERQRHDGGTLRSGIVATMVSLVRTGRARRRPDVTR